MLPLQSDGQSLVQLIDNTRFCLASATRNSVRKSGKTIIIIIIIIIILIIIF